MSNSISHLTSLDPDQIETLGMGYYDKEVYVRDGDILYPVNAPANYQRIQFKKSISTHGRNIPPHLSQIVTVTRTGLSPINQRTDHKLEFTPYTDDSDTAYVMPQTMYPNFEITERYADFFRDSASGGDPVNEAGVPHDYWWFMIYDVKDDDHERFCFLPIWTNRWPTLFDLFNIYAEKVLAVGAMQDVKLFDLQFSDLNMNLQFMPTQMFPFRLDMSLPSMMTMASRDAGVDNHKVVVSLISTTSDVDNTSKEERSLTSTLVKKTLFYSLYEGKQIILTKQPASDLDPYDEPGANFPYFGNTEQLYMICEDLKLTYIVTIYGLPRYLDHYGIYEVMFIIERFPDIIYPENEYEVR
jgi:hypothetical protein